MNSSLQLQTLWVSTWHELGALHAEKLSDYLRDVNRAWLEGRSPSKWATGVFETLEQALQKNRELKRSFNGKSLPADNADDLRQSAPSVGNAS